MDPLEFLKNALPELITNNHQKESCDTFWTTLTFAQSLDGKIAGTNGQQLILSGQESMLMTHWMRSMHDAILVGINTVINDNPQLNTRHLPYREEGYPQPQPVILDTSLRIPPNCKLIVNAAQGKGKHPIVICGPDGGFDDRRSALEALGVKVIPVPTTDGRIPVKEVITLLHDMGHRSLMIEGGQAVISHCLSEVSRKIINRVIVTIAPVFVGVHGTGVTAETDDKMGRLELLVSCQLGADLVAAYRISALE